ncbi:hypothetical protein M5K25_018527 [Dendrobium thyrsiflorum]|uniref:Uncharacterized protein n=1 Tax=Dendrobium thyrsiflorum TaxID=117978 RepID=A0ABD0UQC8_DENTH
MEMRDGRHQQHRGGRRLSRQGRGDLTGISGVAPERLLGLRGALSRHHPGGFGRWHRECNHDPEGDGPARIR